MKRSPQDTARLRSWDSYRERSTAPMISLLVNTTLFLGRPLMHVVLWPIVLYFYVTGKDARRASREYLRRVLQREPRAADILRHFYTFAVVFIDRVYLLSEREESLQIEAHVSEDALRTIKDTRGCLLLVAHFGSFEALRVKGTRRAEAPIRIVLDRQVGRMAMSLLEKLNPVLAARIIDASRRGPELMLDIKQAAEAGHIVGMMADRARADERSLTVSFLGGTVRVPAGPWIVAGMLGIPVVLGFGIYRGRGNYECRLQLFAQRIDFPRERREAVLQDCAQRYVAQLEEQVRAAPYNWFNFFDYWLDDGPAPNATTAH
jgi:predicted LPLAT superfamily acyltransferase